MKKITFFISIVFLGLSVNAQSLLTENTNLHSKRLSLLTLKDISNHLNIKNSIKSSTVFYDSLNNWPLEGWELYKLNGGDGWSELNESSGGHPYEGYACALHNYETTESGGDNWMVTPAVNIGSETFLTFWVYSFSAMNASDFQIIILDKQSPEEATVLDTVYILKANADSSYDNEWINPVINLENYAGKTIYVGFRYYSSEKFGDMYALDEIHVYQEMSKDLAVSAINPDWIFYGKDISPKITVNNLGKQTENSFTAKVEISDASGIIYSDSKTFDNAGIEAGGSTEITFKEWDTPSVAGNYNIKAIVIMDGDEATANDTLIQTTPIVKFEYDNTLIYSHCTADPNTDPNNNMKNHFFSLTKEDGTIDTLSGFNTDLEKLYGGDFTVINETTVLMGVDFTGRIWLINGNGTSYYYGKINYEFTGNGGIYGFTWDSKTDEWYVTNAFDLYKLNKETFGLEKVGQISSTAGIIGIAVDTNGNMYGLGVYDDKLYSIDKTTGAGTAIGEIGYDLNFAQDIGFDRNTNTLYGTLYSTFASQSAYNSALFTINTTSAQLSEIGGSTPMELTVCAIYKNYDTGNGILSNKVSADFNIYPNPVNNTVYISTDKNILEVTISDITGKIVLKNCVNNNIINIDISDIKAGIYIVSIKRNDNVVLNKKIIKK